MSKIVRVQGGDYRIIVDPTLLAELEIQSISRVSNKVTVTTVTEHGLSNNSNVKVVCDGKSELDTDPTSSGITVENSKTFSYIKDGVDVPSIDNSVDPVGTVSVYDGAIVLDTNGLGKVLIDGDLTVTGKTTTVTSEDLVIKDPIIYLNSSEPEDSQGVQHGTGSSGIEINRGQLSNVSIVWDETHPVGSLLTGDLKGTFVFKDSNNSLRGIATNRIDATGNNLSLALDDTGVIKVSGTDTYHHRVLRYTAGEIPSIIEIKQVSRNNGRAVVTTQDRHELSDGITEVVCFSDSSFTDTAAEIFVTGPTTFEYNNPGENVATVNATGVVRPSIIIDPNIIPNIQAVKDLIDATSLPATSIQERDTIVQVNDSEISGSSEITFDVDGQRRATVTTDSVVIDNLKINGNTLSSTTGNVTISPVNSGYVDVDQSFIKNLQNPVDLNDAATKYYADTNTRSGNVLYVSKAGNDLNDGTTLARAKLTLKSALSVATSGTTIFVKSGDYTENNPLLVPRGVSIYGDNLRSVTVRPMNKTKDIFWVNNGVYIANMSFKDHESRAAAIAFPEDGSAGVIYVSPYVQNCTSMTTTGTGMRIDGAHADGLKSMVADAFTQYNQGGIGIHMLNGGNSQLVSIFTICCDIGFLCETGGFCSITNSNSSFGNIGIKADGVSEQLYAGSLVADSSGSVFTIRNLTQKPRVGDAVVFKNISEYFTVQSATDFKVADTNIVQPTYGGEALAINARSSVLDRDIKDKILVDMIDFLNESYPTVNFNQPKATRDGGYIIDAVMDDMVLGTNYKSVQAGLAYYRATAANLIETLKTETLAAIGFIKGRVLEILVNYPAERTTVENNFNTILDIVSNGVSVAPPYVFNPPSSPNSNRVNAHTIIQANRTFMIEEGIAYISVNYPGLTYDQSLCRRDMGFIIDAVSYDMMYVGNSQTADAADEYYSTGNLQIPESEKAVTIAVFNYLKSICASCLLNTPVTRLNTVVTQNVLYPPATSAEVTESNKLFDIVTNLIENAYSSTITITEKVTATVLGGSKVSFYQYSLASSSGHTFEWVGSGTNVNTALPYLGGVPIQENEVVMVNNGKVYFTSTDQRGDFRIGKELVIRRDTGVISGRTFTKSLFAVMTPYILAIGE